MPAITEFAILVFNSPPDFSDATLQTYFRKLSDWQSECSGFPLVFFTELDDPLQIHLVTGWESVAAHEAWIRGERNQELLRLFSPYVDMPKIRMVHLGIDFEDIPKDVGGMVVERYHNVDGDGAVSMEGWDRVTRSLLGKDLLHDRGDMFRFVVVASPDDLVDGGLAPIERWVLERVEPYSYRHPADPC